MTHLGDFALGDTLYFWVNTHNPATGAAQESYWGVGATVYDGSGQSIHSPDVYGLSDTGHYGGSFVVSAENGFAVGKMYCIRIGADVLVDGELITAGDIQTFRVVAAAAEDPTAMILPAAEEA